MAHMSHDDWVGFAIALSIWFILATGLWIFGRWDEQKMDRENAEYRARHL